MGQQESRRLLRSRRLHPRLQRQAPPRLHREQSRAQEQRRRHHRRDRVQ